MTRAGGRGYHPRRSWPPHLHFHRSPGRHRRRAAPRAQRGRLPRRPGDVALRRRRRHGRPRRRGNGLVHRRPDHPGAHPGGAGRRAGRLRAPADAEDARHFPSVLRLAVESACRAIYGAAQEDPSLAGMGTTVTAALVAGRTAFVAHVGDSRCYLLRGGRIFQLSEDHSLVNEQLKAGAITEEEARQSRFRNIITRSVGFEEDVLVDVVGARGRAGRLHRPLLRRPHQPRHRPGDPGDRHGLPPRRVGRSAHRSRQRAWRRRQHHGDRGEGNRDRKIRLIRPLHYVRVTQCDLMGLNLNQGASNGLGRQWAGGRIWKEKDGSRTYHINRMVKGVRYAVSTRTTSLEAARVT